MINTQDILSQIQDVFSFPCEQWDAMEHREQYIHCASFQGYSNRPGKNMMGKERPDRTQVRSGRPSGSSDGRSEDDSGIAMQVYSGSGERDLRHPALGKTDFCISN